MAAYCDTSGNVWGYWTSTSSSTCTASTASSGVWGYWAASSTSTATTCSTSSTDTSAVWRVWGTGAIIRQQPAYQSPPPPTEEQLAAERARAEEWKRKCEEEKRLREAAEERAAELLKQHLDDEQRRQFEKERKFRVVAGDGATFELEYGWSGNVKELDKAGKNRIASYCIHPKEDVPKHDNLLAQKLLLEADPASFRKIANRTPVLT